MATADSDLHDIANCGKCSSGHSGPFCPFLSLEIVVWWRSQLNGSQKMVKNSKKLGEVGHSLENVPLQTLIIIDCFQKNARMYRTHKLVSQQDISGNVVLCRCKILWLLCQRRFYIQKPPSPRKSFSDPSSLRTLNTCVCGKFAHNLWITCDHDHLKRCEVLASYPSQRQPASHNPLQRSQLSYRRYQSRNLLSLRLWLDIQTESCI